MFKNARLRTKLFIWITTAVGITFLAVIFIVSSISLEGVKQGLNRTAMEIAGKFAYRMKAEFEASRTVAVTMKSTFEALKNAGATDRKMMDTLLEHILEADEKMLSLCLGYEPNALDGKDDTFRNATPGHDHTGRYLPYIFRDNGKISIEPLAGYDTEHWYHIPKKTLKEYLPDPFYYRVSGKDTLLVSFLFPLMHDGKFMGIVSADITLDRLQKMVQDVKPYGTGTVAVLANNGAYVAHVDREQLNRKVKNKSVKQAVKNGEQHISFEDEFYTAYYPIRLGTDTPAWSVEVRVQKATVLASAIQIRNYVIMVSALGLFVIVLITFFITRSITQPLMTLAATAEEFGRGNFEADIEEPENSDEIGSLTHAFRIMARKIKSLIGDLKRHAAELQEKNDDLKRMDELKDQFLANTSHELRTPINGIVGIMESMLNEAAGPLNEDQIHNLSLVNNSARRLSHLINDVLDLTKLKNRELDLQKKPVALSPIVEMIFRLLQPLAHGKPIKLKNAVPEGIPFVAADENRIHQILLNLIDNAIRYTESGSITVNATQEEGNVCVSVIDTGIGIPPDKLDRIFESFEQVDGSISRTYGGTGLGLSITKKLLELHGSTITVSSTLEQGSVFRFSLPIADDISESSFSKDLLSPILPLEKPAEPSAHILAREDTPAVVSSKKHILVVDDEPINIQVLVNILTMQGYTVTTALSGKDALEKLDANPSFDLILLDLMMPNMSGYEVCEKIRSKYPLFELPVLILTAKNQVSDILLGFKAGANDYVQKPFEGQELMARVETLIMLKQSVDYAMHSLTQLESEKQKRVMAETLRDVTRSINSTLELDEVLQRVLQAVPRFVDFKYAVMLINADDAYVVKTTAGYPREILPEGTVIDPNDDGLLSEILQTKNTVYVSNWEINQPIPLKKEDERCVAGIPILYNEGVQGVLIVSVESMETDTVWLNTLAEQAGTAIENARLFDKIQLLATTDGLTGMNNRRHFFDLVQKEFKRFLRYAHPVTVFMCDIDKFKNVNDTYGHAAGDQVLIQVAKIIKENMRETDIVGRYGGEEFVAMLPHTSLEEAAGVAEKVRAEVEMSEVPIETHKPLKVTISMGVVAFLGDIKDVSMVFDRADKALYDAKMSGRNRVVVRQMA